MRKIFIDGEFVASSGETSAVENPVTVEGLEEPKEIDAAFYKALSSVLEEWTTEIDEQAFPDL